MVISLVFWHYNIVRGQRSHLLFDLPMNFEDNYCAHFGNDMTWLRNLGNWPFALPLYLFFFVIDDSEVHAQFVLETAQTAMTVADGFHWFVYGYGNLNKLGEYYLANFDSPILCSIIAFISQGVYCWRIYHLSQWKTPTLIIVLVSNSISRLCHLWPRH